MGTEEQNLDQLAALLDHHEITDDTGQIGDETSSEITADANETTEENTDITAEKSEESKEEAPKADSIETEKGEEPELAVDDSGKQYIPKNRFDKVYGKLKEAERLLQERQTSIPTSSVPAAPMAREDAIEVELTKIRVPQIDPSSPEYDPVIDELGYTFYQASMRPDKKGNMVPTITRMEAAKKALDQAAKLGRQIASEKQVARIVKAENSDSGITSRVTSRVASNDVPGENASLEEMEAYLRKTGNW